MHHTARYLFDSGLALFAVMVWIIYRKQLVTMGNALAETHASNGIAERALVTSRRAWLVIRGHPEFTQMGTWCFDKVTIENISDMPAVIHSYGSGILEGKLEDLALREEQRIRSGRFVIRGESTSLAFLQAEVEMPASPAS